MASSRKKSDFRKCRSFSALEMCVLSDCHRGLFSLDKDTFARHRNILRYNFDKGVAHLKDLRFASDVERNEEITDTRNL